MAASGVTCDDVDDDVSIEAAATLSQLRSPSLKLRLTLRRLHVVVPPDDEALSVDDDCVFMLDERDDFECDEFCEFRDDCELLEERDEVFDCREDDEEFEEFDDDLSPLCRECFVLFVVVVVDVSESLPP